MPDKNTPDLRPFRVERAGELESPEAQARARQACPITVWADPISTHACRCGEGDCYTVPVANCIELRESFGMKTSRPVFVCDCQGEFVS